MEPALGVTVLWLLFAASHIGLATRPVRTALVGGFGMRGWSIVYQAVAVGVFVALVRFYALHRTDGAPGLGLGRLAVVGWLAIALIVAGVVLTTTGAAAYTSLPMAFHAPRVEPARGVARITRHPMFAGLALVAFGHTLVATRLAGTAFAAGLAATVVAGMWHQDRKLLARWGEPYGAFMASTSAIPFAAIARGRNWIAWRELPWGAFAVGLVLALALRSVHDEIFAYGGAWVIGTVLATGSLLTLQSWTQGSVASADPSPVSRARAIACAGAVLLAYVGVVHEVVGTTLYPDGPAWFGGALGWHAAGAALIVLGLVTAAGTLRFV